ncbi:TPA: hypothetical protein ACT5CR_007743, partial [Burkholderia cenocepacia]
RQRTGIGDGHEREHLVEGRLHGRQSSAVSGTATIVPPRRFDKRARVRITVDFDSIIRGEYCPNNRG